VHRIGDMIAAFVRSSIIAVSLALLLSRANAIDWPEGYVVQENTESSDGRYGVLVPTLDTWEKDESVGEANYLADVKSHRLLGNIKGVDYFHNRNHAGLEGVWAANSKACVVQYDARYGWDLVFVLKLKDDGFEQIDIGKHIEAVQKRIFDGYLSGYYRFRPDGKLKVRALSYTNPKQLADEPTFNGLFEGTFDLTSQKWTSSSARKIKSEDWENLQVAYDDNFAKHMIVAADDKQVPEGFTGQVFRSEEEKFDELDRRLNEVYQAVRFLLPNHFAKVKQEQITWLKTRDAGKSVEEKSKLTENRIKALQDLLW